MAQPLREAIAQRTRQLYETLNHTYEGREEMDLNLTFVCDLMQERIRREEMVAYTTLVAIGLALGPSKYFADISPERKNVFEKGRNATIEFLSILEGAKHMTEGTITAQSSAERKALSLAQQVTITSWPEQGIAEFREFIIAQDEQVRQFYWF